MMLLETVLCFLENVTLNVYYIREKDRNSDMLLAIFFSKDTCLSFIRSLCQ